MLHAKMQSLHDSVFNQCLLRYKYMKFILCVFHQFLGLFSHQRNHLVLPGHPWKKLWLHPCSKVGLANIWFDFINWITDTHPVIVLYQINKMTSHISMSSAILIFVYPMPTLFHFLFTNLSNFKLTEKKWHKKRNIHYGVIFNTSQQTFFM